jgi:hypothetical protein
MIHFTALGSVREALDGSGNAAAAQLYAPYGGLRYSSGTMPTAKGFAGQRPHAPRLRAATPRG